MDPADADQLERIRAKAYALVESDPGGPNADQARRILAKLPKLKMGRNLEVGTRAEPGSLPVQGELSGGDIGSELPATPDEEVGIPSRMQTMSLPQKAAITALVPENRRQFERGMDDMLTFGVGQKLARVADWTSGGGKFTPEQAAEDARTSPNARTYGRVAGALTGKGLTGLVGRGALGATARITGAGKGFLGRGLAGAIGGAAANEAAMPIIAGSQTAVAGPNKGEELLPFVQRIGEVMKNEASNPINPLIGGILGAGSGMARNIRDTGQTGRDIRLVEEYGATPSRIGRGPQGGVFDSPFFQHVEGSAQDQGAASRRAAETVMGDIETQGRNLNAEYGASKTAARDQGWLEGKVNTDAVREDAQKLIAGTGLTTGERSAIEREVLAELDKYPGGMTVDQFNDFRGKLGRVFGVGPGETSVPAIDVLRQAAKRTIDETEMGPINEAYSKGRQRISRQHEQLGISEGGRRDVQERRIANVIQRRANDEAPGTGIQEAGDLGTEQFLAENAQHRPMFDTARLLAARERMTAGIEPQGGFFRRVGKHGLLEKNLEPALVGLYRLGVPLERGNIPASLAAQFLLSGGPREPVRQEDFSDQIGAK